MSRSCVRSRLRISSCCKLCKAALHNSVQAGLGQISSYHHVALLDKLDDPELRVWYEGSGPRTSSYAIWSLAPATPSAHSS